MEQTLTLLAFAAAALFSLWILLTDPASEDVHSGIDTAFLGALLMLPVIILLIAGIILLVPIVAAIALVLLVLYGIFMALRWFLTRDRDDATRAGSRD